MENYTTIRVTKDVNEQLNTMLEERDTATTKAELIEQMVKENRNEQPKIIWE